MERTGRYPKHLRAHYKQNTNPSIKGFIVGLMALLPLFIMCLMVLTAEVFMIRNYNAAQRICIQSVLRAQTILKAKLTSLLSLNAKADRLRKAQKTTQAMYDVLREVEPVSAAVLLTKLIKIKAQRILLAARQKSILISSRIALEKTFAGFKKKLKRFHARWTAKQSPPLWPLAVKAQPAGDLAPSYKPKPHFSKRQRVRFSWSFKLYYNLPNWIRKEFFNSQLSHYDCAGTLYRKGSKWAARLTY